MEWEEEGKRGRGKVRKRETEAEGKRGRGKERKR